jgi:hypothetical protein
MGYYGDEKRRQMVRSILPCVAQSRKAIRDDLNKRRRKNRRLNNRILDRYTGGTATEAIELYDDLGEDFGIYVEMHHGDSDYYDIVQERRNRDHLNHFIHWGQQITKHLDPRERMDYIRSILPAGQIGEHAMQHMDAAIGFDIRYEYIEPWQERQARHRAERRAIEKPFVIAVHRAIINVAHSDVRRRKFNKFMLDNCAVHRIKVPCAWDDVGAIENHYKYRMASLVRPYWGYCPQYYKWVECSNVRIIRGYHDAQRFYNDLFSKTNGECHKGPHRHTDWLEKVVEYFKIEVPDGINLDHFRLKPEYVPTLYR